MNNKADVAHWNRLHATARASIAPRTDLIRRWIERHVPRADSPARAAIEIGCCPGRYLAVLGELGYQLNGIDLADNIGGMPAWLADRGYRVGEFLQQDFTAFAAPRRFDVVMSLGFIEHFTDWERVLAKHCDLVAPGGTLILEAPNFIGSFQHWFHSKVDAESLARHHGPAMDVEAWARLLRERGFTIDYSGYFGRFDFWVEPQPRTVAQRAVLTAFAKTRRLLRALLPPDRKSYSPVGGVIARRLE